MLFLLKRRKLTIFVLAMTSLLVLNSPGFSQEMARHPEENPEVDSAGTDSDEPDQSRGIIGGQVDTGHPQVGKVITEDSGCSGTLIGSRTVLTAAHCAEDGEIVDFELEAGDRGIYSGTFHRHPNYDGFNEFIDEFDLAVITLEQNRPLYSQIQPIPLCTTEANLENLPFTIVGYGVTSRTGDDYGTKHRAGVEVSESSETHLLVNSSNGRPLFCFGDSGGPALISGIVDGRQQAEECVIGVASTTDYCQTRTVHVRSDGHRDWIDGFGDPTVQWATAGRMSCYEDEGGRICSFLSDWSCYEDEGGRICGWGRENEPDDGSSG